jgi:PleD family two-component response regulator
MGQIVHGSARTTEAVRRAIQHSQESRVEDADKALYLAKAKDRNRVERYNSDPISAAAA